MPNIPIADKATLDAINALVGTTNPSSGDLTTLFKGLKLIADYVDTLETKVGTNADGAGSTTLFARMAQIAGYVDGVESALSAGVVMGRTATPGNYSTSSSSLQTALSISGKGTLLQLALKNVGSTYIANAAECKVTIDGTTVFDNTFSGNLQVGYSVFPCGEFIIGGSGSGFVASGGTTLNMDFKTSLKIEIKSDGTNSLRVYWTYNT